MIPRTLASVIMMLSQCEFIPFGVITPLLCSLEKEKKKKRHKHSSGDKDDSKKAVNSPPKEMDVDRDVPSPPPPSIFKDKSRSTNGDTSDKSTAKQHTVKERSAGVEAGLIKPKPRGSKPNKSANTKSVTATGSSLSSSKRCVWSIHVDYTQVVSLHLSLLFLVISQPFFTCLVQMSLFITGDVYIVAAVRPQ